MNKFCSGIIFLGGRKDFCSHHFLYHEGLPIQGKYEVTQKGDFFPPEGEVCVHSLKERLVWMVS